MVVGGAVTEMGLKHPVTEAICCVVVARSGPVARLHKPQGLSQFLKNHRSSC